MLRNLVKAVAKKRKRASQRKEAQARSLARTSRLSLEPLESRQLLSVYPALQRPTELQYWDSTHADNGYNFYGVSGTTYLLDMEGKVLHTWPVGNNPHLLSNGNVLDTNTNDPSGFSGFKEVTWEGATAWSYLESRSTYHPHHDFTRIFNPKLNQYTTLYTCPATCGNGARSGTSVITTRTVPTRIRPALPRAVRCPMASPAARCAAATGSTASTDTAASPIATRPTSAARKTRTIRSITLDSGWCCRSAPRAGRW